MLGLNLAGVRYEWTSAPILLLFGTALVGRRACSSGGCSPRPNR